ncbi:hypothetical protein BPIT_35460 [Candidatus Brocadia pituitae]|nr:hypothetical protein BPIT_35460 [Candidatus Brocadia pituitae]
MLKLSKYFLLDTNEDPNAFLWSRIAEALQWDRAVKKVEQLANSYKVNTKKNRS